MSENLELNETLAKPSHYQYRIPVTQDIKKLGRTRISDFSSVRKQCAKHALGILQIFLDQNRFTGPIILLDRCNLA